MVSFWDFLKLLSHHFLNLKTLPCQRECFIREGMKDAPENGVMGRHRENESPEETLAWGV